MVFVHDEEGHGLFLNRDPASLKAREDPATKALPSLRTDANIFGGLRAEHALQLLFGPVRAYEELASLHSGLRLRGMVVTTKGKATDRCGFYTVCVRSLKELHIPLLDAFLHRRSLLPASVSRISGLGDRNAEHSRLGERLAIEMHLDLPRSPVVSASFPRPPSGIRSIRKTPRRMRKRQSERLATSRPASNQVRRKWSTTPSKSITIRTLRLLE